MCKENKKNNFIQQFLQRVFTTVPKYTFTRILSQCFSTPIFGTTSQNVLDVSLFNTLAGWWAEGGSPRLELRNAALRWAHSVCVTQISALAQYAHSLNAYECSMHLFYPWGGNVAAAPRKMEEMEHQQTTGDVNNKPLKSDITPYCFLVQMIHQMPNANNNQC